MSVRNKIVGIPKIVKSRKTERSDLHRVDLIAAGYEWNCPKCLMFHRIYEAKKTVTCQRCLRKFETNPPEHAWRKA